MSWTYPAGSVGTLIASGHVAPPTRAALEARLAAPKVVAPRWFDPHAFATLAAACARLLAGPIEVDVAGAIDSRLAGGGGDGWRYDVLPPDGEAYRLGVGCIDATAMALHGGDFIALDAARQDAVLAAVEAGPTGAMLNAARWFEELLAEAVETYYAHPLVLASIGYAGMADLPGWVAIGLDERDPREPVE